jgi:hypothetical protein
MDIRYRNQSQILCKKSNVYLEVSIMQTNPASQNEKLIPTHKNAFVPQLQPMSTFCKPNAEAESIFSPRRNQRWQRNYKS